MVEEFKPKELRTMKDHVHYLQQCAYDNYVPDIKITAELILSISDSPSHKGYYEGSKADPDYIEVWDLAAELEVPDDDKEFRKMKWGMIEKRVQILHERYVSLQVPTSNHQ